MVQAPGLHSHIIIYVTYHSAQYARLFVPGRPLQLSLIFVSKARAYPSEEPLGVPLHGKLLGLFTNIKLGWKSLLETSYEENSLVNTAPV